MPVNCNAEGMRIAALPNLTGEAMANELSIVPTHNLDHDLYASSQARERALNTAILQANISESFEEYLEIFDEFYADEVEVGSETGKSRFVEKRECAHLSPTSWFRFT